MSDWESLFDTIREMYLPELEDGDISGEKFTKVIDSISNACILASSLAEKEGEKERWKREALKIWGKIADSPACQKYFHKKRK